MQLKNSATKRSKTVSLFAEVALLCTMLLSCATKVVPDEVLSKNDYENATEKFFDSSLIISEENYEDDMAQIVLPYLSSLQNEGILKTWRGSEIYYETFSLPKSKDTIVIFNGFLAFSKKFNEVIYYFLKSGYSVCIFDHRGQGLSSREVEDSSLAYIDDFSIYTDDALEIVEKIARPMTKGDILLFAHSMGGCIGAVLLEEKPDLFKKAVLSTPMLAVQTVVPEGMAHFLSFCKVKLGQGKNIVVGFKRFNSNFSYNDKKPRAESKSRAKYQHALRKANTSYQTSAATYSWLLTAIRTTHTAIKKENVKKATTPILMFKAENDKRVRESGEDAFCRESDTTTLVFYPDVEHEIYNSKNEYLASYYNRIFAFFAE